MGWDVPYYSAQDSADALLAERRFGVLLVPAAASRLEVVVPDRNGSGGKSGQKLLDFRGTFPGEDAFAPVDATEDVDDRFHDYRIRGTVNH